MDIVPTSKERMRRVKIGLEWVRFRQRHLYTQKRLAEALGISRRAVQYVERGNPAKPDWPCMPKPETLARFRALKTSFEKGR